MKKVFMSLAVASVMVAAVSCGNCCSKKGEKAAEEAVATESACTKTCCDSTSACCDSTKTCCDSTKVAE